MPLYYTTNSNGVSYHKSRYSHSTMEPNDPETVPNFETVSTVSPTKQTIDRQDLHSVTSNKIWSKLRIVKNLIIVSVGFLLLFTAYEGLTMLQSTMNGEQGVGMASQAVIYAFFCISALFLPKVIIRKLGCKLTLTLGILTYCPYIAANFYPHWATLIPSAALLGMGASLLWASKCTYLNELSRIYSKHVSEPVDSITAWFFGISAMFFLSTQVWGNLISYLVLKRSRNNNYVNETAVFCGMQFCDDNSHVSNTNLQVPSVQMRYILTGIFVICSVLSALLIALFLDSLQRDLDREKGEKIPLSIDLATATFTLMKKKYQLLLMPLVFFVGLKEGFYIGDFTKSYVACSWGVYHVGFVSMFYGVSCALSSTICGRLIKYFGRFPIFFAAAVVNLAVLVELLTWNPDPEHPYMFFVIAGMFGFCNGIYTSQLMAFYGLLFTEEEESAFANYYLWNSLGYCLSFSYSTYLCTQDKVYVVIFFFCVGIAGYTTTEISLINSQQSGNAIITDLFPCFRQKSPKPVESIKY